VVIGKDLLDWHWQCWWPRWWAFSALPGIYQGEASLAVFVFDLK
jgi:hypothetical protein